MAGIGTGQAGVGADLAMFMIVFVAFFGAHAADLLTYQEVLLSYLRIALNQPGSLKANVCTVAIKFDATCQERDIFFVQAGSLTFFTGKSTIDQFFKQLLIDNSCVVGLYLDSHSC